MVMSGADAGGIAHGENQWRLATISRGGGRGGHWLTNFDVSVLAQIADKSARKAYEFLLAQLVFDRLALFIVALLNSLFSTHGIKLDTSRYHRGGRHLAHAGIEQIGAGRLFDLIGRLFAQRLHRSVLHAADQRRNGAARLKFFAQFFGFSQAGRDRRLFGAALEDPSGRAEARIRSLSVWPRRLFAWPFRHLPY